MSCLYKIKNLTLHDLPNIMDIGQRAYNISWSATMMRDTIRAAHTQVWGIFEETWWLVCVLSYLMVFWLLQITKKSYGCNLLKFLIDKARYGKVDNFYVEVRKSNVPALNLFKKTGFKQLSLRKDYYLKFDQQNLEVREDALILGLYLGK